MNHNIQDDINAYQVKQKEAATFLNTIHSLYGSHIESVMKRYATATISTYTHHYCGPSDKAIWSWEINSDTLVFGWTEYWGGSEDSDNYTMPLTYLSDDSLLPAFEAECAAKVKQNEADSESKKRLEKLYQFQQLQKELGL